MLGNVTCVDCQDGHDGQAVRGTDEAMENEIETCTRCHTAQRGPFVSDHNARRKCCSACHNPHGSVNQRMLVARDANLCLRCHLEAPTPGSSGEINASAIRHTTDNHNARLQQGTCWVAGCQEAPHGSNVKQHLRR